MKVAVIVKYNRNAEEGNRRTGKNPDLRFIAYDAGIDKLRGLKFDAVLVQEWITRSEHNNPTSALQDYFEVLRYISDGKVFVL